jgi:3-hydroxyacyl-CoA dehydrogenase
MDEEERYLKKIEALQEAFSNIKKEHDHHFHHILNTFKQKMKENPVIVENVESFVNNYVIAEYENEAREVLYGMLAAEMVDAIRTLSKTSCTIS